MHAMQMVIPDEYLIWCYRTITYLIPTWQPVNVILFLKAGKEISVSLHYCLTVRTDCMNNKLEVITNVYLVWITEMGSDLSFRHSSSTTNPLVKLEVTIMCQGITMKWHVFFDIKKAYDTTWHTTSSSSTLNWTHIKVKCLFNCCEIAFLGSGLEPPPRIHFIRRGRPAGQSLQHYLVPQEQYGYGQLCSTRYLVDDFSTSHA